MTGYSPFATYHPLPFNHSPFAIRYSLLSYSPFAIGYSLPFTEHFATPP